MGTPCKKVYDAFLARINQEEWDFVDDKEELEADMYQLLQMAINRFVFPNVSIAINGDNFEEEIGNDEIQVLAVYMKNEWLKRSMATWSLLEQQYHTKDFNFLSQANHLDKLKAAVELSNKECLNMLNLYHRKDKDEKNKPFKWSDLAGERH